MVACSRPDMHACTAQQECALTALTATSLLPILQSTSPHGLCTAPCPTCDAGCAHGAFDAVRPLAPACRGATALQQLRDPCRTGDLSDFRFNRSRTENNDLYTTRASMWQRNRCLPSYRRAKLRTAVLLAMSFPGPQHRPHMHLHSCFHRATLNISRTKCSIALPVLCAGL